jgi:hypothetical protein
VTVDTEIQDALAARTRTAHNASAVFDYEAEGSLATFWRQATPGTTYWRGYVPMKALPGQVLPIASDSIEMGDGELILHRQRGTAIWQFLGDDGRSRIAVQMKRQGLRTLMEVDDTYVKFAPPLYGRHGAWTRTHKEALANGTGYSVEMHRTLVPQMDGIIVATEQLAEVYAEYNPNVYVCRNSVDPTDWSVERTESDALRIGYYGSPSHMRDYPRVKKAIKWASRQPGVEIVFVGFKPPASPGTLLPWADDLFDARKGLGHIDVGIAPLTRNPWADGKSDVKALEYAMAGVMPIVEDAPPYSPWAEIGWPFMPSTEDEWMDVIRDAVTNRDKVKGLAAKAKEYVLGHRTIAHEIENWRAAING